MSLKRGSVALITSQPSQMTIPQALAPHIRVVVLNLIETPHSRWYDVNPLADLLINCRNLAVLDIAAPSISGLAARLLGQLLTLRTLNVRVDGPQSGADLGSFLRLLPNLDTIVRLPPVFGVLSVGLTAHDPLRLRQLTISYQYCAALPLLAAGLWTARNVVFTLSSSTWRRLEEIDWSATGPLLDTRDIAIRMSHSRPGGPAPALAFVLACPTLRRLELRGKAGDIAAMLPAITSSCRCLREIMLRLHNTPLPREALEDIADVLRETTPRSLRSIRIYSPMQAACFELLESSLAARRISTIILDEGQLHLYEGLQMS
ncbi:hypothetical protein AURDEDRAFT_166187 [Auricularia subglabra TFB-10046 SS5]|nr:hypothetical protein AURDEDRAFT_166187 [Auricularia subglabra TFB-10046 SS5]